MFYSYVKSMLMILYLSQLIKIFVKNLKIATNPVQHKRTNHIDIHHHFLSGHVSKGDIMMESVRI
jgi:hypothetical protein